MDKSIEDFYKEQFMEKGFLPDPDNHTYCEIGSTWKLSDQIGEGTFWFYGQQDLFDIKIHNFFFHEDTVLNWTIPGSTDMKIRTCLRISKDYAALLLISIGVRPSFKLIRS